MDQASEYKQQGNEAFKNKDFSKAVEYFTKAIELKPQDHILYSNRSGAYTGLSNYEQALEDANSCLTYDSKFIKGYSRKAAALEGLGKFDEALETVEKGLEIDPNSELLLEKKEEINQAKNGGGSDDFLGGFPGGMPDQNMQQNMLMQLLSNPETAKLFQDPSFLQKFQDVQTNPGNIMKYMNDPQFMQVMGALSGARGGGFGGSQNPGFNPRQQSAPTTAQGSKMDEEDIPRWEEPTRQEHKREQPAPQKSKQQSEAEKEKEAGNAAYKQKQFDVAITHYRKAIELEPQTLVFRSNLLAVLIEKKEFDLALQECVEAEKVYNETEPRLRKSEDLAKIYARQARIYELQDKIEESISYFNKSLLESKEYKVEQELKRVKNEKKLKDEKNYLNPELGAQARDRGNKLFSDGKFTEALVEYQDAIKRNPKDAKSYNNRATCYVKLMEYNLAIKEVEKALEIEPTFVKALVRKGSIHHVLKEYHKATEVLERALTIDPEDESAKDQLRKTRMAISGDMHNQTEGNDEERMRRAMADPEIQQLMMDPMLKIALGKMQEDPKNAHTYFNDKTLGPKLQKLIQAGIIKVA